MKKLLGTALCCIWIQFAFSQTPAGDTLRWQGQLGARRIVLKALPPAGSNAKGWIDAPEQFVNNQSATAFLFRADSLMVQGPEYVGTFRGKLSADSSTATGNWFTREGVKALVLHKVLQLQPVVLPQTPKPPFSYKSTNVIFYNADSTVRFGGTLTVPASGKNIPAVVLISGTGQQDRNGTMAGHQLFAVLADFLSRNGIAVLRVDDRGVNETTGNYATTTTGEFADDALAGIRLLQSQTGINPGKIGLIGHSEGGAAACIAASRSSAVAFVVSLSGPGINGMDAFRLQNKAIIDKAPITAVNRQRFNSVNDTLFSVAVQYAADSSEMDKQLRAAYAAWHIKDSVFVATQDPKQTDHFFFPFESYARQATGRWYRSFITYDPAHIFPQIKVPVLALNGDKDVISLYEQNIAGFQRYIKSSLLHTWVVPGVNHLYQHCETCTTQEYSSLSETFAPEVLTRIAAFINKQVK